MSLPERIYIARAIDGSWTAPTPAFSEDEARALIEEHEPELSRRDRYHILVESLPKLLAAGPKSEGLRVRATITQRLVKWDGDGPIPDDAADHPEKYAQVAEVIEGGDGKVSKVIYRRS